MVQPLLLRAVFILLSEQLYKAIRNLSLILCKFELAVHLTSQQLAVLSPLFLLASGRVHT